MKPYLVVFHAISLDGRLSGFEPDVGRYYACAGHWQVDAILAGADTMLTAAGLSGPAESSAFPPQLDSSLPLLVVPDSQGRIRNWRALRHVPYWRDMLVLCSETTSPESLRRLEDDGIRFWVVGRDKVDLPLALERLYHEEGIQTVRADCGGTLNGILLEQDLVDEVSVLLQPTLVGGQELPLVPRAVQTRLRLPEVECLPDGLVWLRYRVQRDAER